MVEKRIAFITGITGQDGSYLSDFLLKEVKDIEYTVYGIIRRSSSFNTQRVEHLYKDNLHVQNSRFKLIYGDMTDTANLISIINKIKPDEIYNLAAQSHVKVSFELPEYTTNVDATGTLRILEAIRACGLTDKVKFYQASTSELYGKVQEIPQSETTPFYPRSPYACAKLYSYWIVRNYREAYGIHASNGILFNHESIRRGATFVTRKITMAVARIRAGIQKCLFLGNLDAKRDWGHAYDYVRAMWMILQAEKPDDWVVATGETHSVREFCEIAFKHGGMEIEWKGEKGTPSEYGVDKATGNTVIAVDERYFRPTEVDLLIGTPAKIEKALGWKRKVSFPQLVEGMVKGDIALLENANVELEKSHFQ